MMTRTDENNLSSIRVGGRVPVTNDKGFTYVEVGVNLDVRHVNRNKDEVSLDVTGEISGAVEPTNQQTPLSGAPVIRQTRWSSTVLTPIRKPTLIFASDDPTSKRQLQLELTVTPVH
jgi:hypothetical protein